MNKEKIDGGIATVSWHWIKQYAMLAQLAVYMMLEVF